MPVFIDNNNYIAWLYIGGYQNILPALGPYCTCPADACNMVLAWAIYSGIPLIAMQYNINISLAKGNMHLLNLSIMQITILWHLRLLSEVTL